MSDAVAGAVVGAGAQFASPYINQYVPRVMNLSPMTIALLGGGVVAKGVLHKGGKWSSAAIQIGAAMAAQQLMSGSSTSSGAGVFS